VRLVWQDNAENETGYRIWMAGLGYPARVVATLEASPGSGPAWFQFPSPSLGIFSFWVEAFNLLGSQPGEPVWAGVNQTNCPDPLAADLIFEVLDLTVAGGYGRVYCYISVEDAPEVRFPMDDGVFVELSGFQGDLSGLPEGKRRFIFPIPGDAALDVIGKCLGWQGGALSELGEFSGSVPSEKWDGSRQTVGSPTFEIGFRINARGELKAVGQYGYLDPTIAAPYGLNLEQLNLPAASSGQFEPERLLRWRWDGDEADISGFTVFINGRPYAPANPHERDLVVRLPSRCGGVISIGVAANRGPALSTVAPLVVTQDPCGVLVDVHFKDLVVTRAVDGEPGDCDNLEVWFHLIATANGNHVDKNLVDPSGEDGFFLSCGNWTFAGLSGPNQYFEGNDHILITMPPDDTGMLEIKVTMWELDPRLGFFNWVEDGEFVINQSKVIALPYADWDGHHEEFQWDIAPGRDISGYMTIEVSAEMESPNP
jgi:hypothetical protein